MVSFEITKGTVSHASAFGISRFDYVTEGEIAGQLVRCLSGEMTLFGHAGEWVIPPEHMVYIPHGRMFRLRANVAASGHVVQFCNREVKWSHDGCWVGPSGSFASEMLDYSMKWGAGTKDRNRQARSFFVTLGEMLPGWFRNERIMWTPYSENSTIQRVIDFVNERGPAITLPEAAVFVGMSERTLRRHMQTELGQNWRDFIREMRMNCAMKLLGKERRSVTQTAFEVGFSSSSAFSSAFANYVGRTPSAYAKAFDANLRPSLVR